MAPLEAKSKASSSMEARGKVVGVAEEDPSVSVSVTKAKKQQLRKKKKKAEKFKRLLRSSDEDDLLTLEVTLATEMRLRCMEGTVCPMRPIGRDYNSAKDFRKKKDDDLINLSRIKALLALLDE